MAKYKVVGVLPTTILVRVHSNKKSMFSHHTWFAPYNTWPGLQWVCAKSEGAYIKKGRRLHVLLTWYLVKILVCEQNILCMVRRSATARPRPMVVYRHDPV